MMNLLAASDGDHETLPLIIWGAHSSSMQRLTLWHIMDAFRIVMYVIHCEKNQIFTH